MTRPVTDHAPDGLLLERLTCGAPVVAATLTTGDDVDPESYLAETDDVDVEPVSDVESLPDVESVAHAEESIDCVVCGSSADAVDEALGVLSALRKRAASLPFVLLTVEPDGETLDPLFEADLADVVMVAPAGTGRRLAHRIHTIVTAHRQIQLAKHALAAAEAVREGVATVNADGVIALSTRSFARQFGTTPASLRGTDWRRLFDENAVDRIESNGLAAVADGWEWIGTCVGRRGEDESVSLQTRVAAVETAGFVLAVSHSSPEEY